VRVRDASGGSGEPDLRAVTATPRLEQPGEARSEGPLLAVLLPGAKRTERATEQERELCALAWLYQVSDEIAVEEDQVRSGHSELFAQRLMATDEVVMRPGRR
jgi:hypothetical protein